MVTKQTKLILIEGDNRTAVQVALAHMEASGHEVWSGTDLDRSGNYCAIVCDKERNEQTIITVLASACIHFQEYIDTGNEFDLCSAHGAMAHPDVAKWIEENPALLPVRRDGKGPYEK